MMAMMTPELIFKIGLLIVGIFLLFWAMSAMGINIPGMGLFKAVGGVADTLGIGLKIATAPMKLVGDLLDGKTLIRKSRVADCQDSTYTNNGLTCGRGSDDYRMASSLADCKDKDYTNMGATCYRPPHAYSSAKGGCTTIWKKYKCKAGYTDMGCHCQRWASSKSMSHMKCPPGQKKRGARCYKTCLPGYDNTGEGCHRLVSTKGAGFMKCGNGETLAAGRCYARCPKGTKEAGLFCKQKDKATLKKEAKEKKAREKEMLKKEAKEKKARKKAAKEKEAFDNMWN